MSKNIIIFCDGTANEFERDHTNVLKLCSATVKNSSSQWVYYHPGIGTKAPAGFATTIGGKVARCAGLAFGYGLKDDICDAYIFIMNSYEAGDRIFLFGFSRGAYTARALAALLHMYGLATRGNEALVPYAVKMLWDINGKTDDTDIAERTNARYRLASKFKESLARPCPVHFLGLWDTVSSVGWVGSPVALPFTKGNPGIHIARHAVSIDEHRAYFRTNLFAPAKVADLKQVWFPGVHCDVGGGYPEEESGLSKFALEWVASEARKAGLHVDDERLDLVLGKIGTEYAPADPRSKRHESLTGAWNICEFLPKRYWDRDAEKETIRFNFYRRRTLGPRPCIHDAAWQISSEYTASLPTDAIRLSEMNW